MFGRKCSTVYRLVLKIARIIRVDFTYSRAPNKGGHLGILVKRRRWGSCRGIHWHLMVIGGSSASQFLCNLSWSFWYLLPHFQCDDRCLNWRLWRPNSQVYSVTDSFLILRVSFPHFTFCLLLLLVLLTEQKIYLQISSLYLIATYFVDLLFPIVVCCFTRGRWDVFAIFERHTSTDTTWWPCALFAYLCRAITPKCANR